MQRQTQVLAEKTAEQANRLAYKDMKTSHYIIATMILYVIITIVAFFVDSVDIVLNFASAISISALAFVFPGAYLLKGISKFDKNAS